MNGTEDKPVESTEPNAEETQASETPKKEEAPKEDWKSKYLYQVAEMDNMRKRFER